MGTISRMIASLDDRGAASRRAASAGRRALSSFLDGLLSWTELARQRRALRRLDDRLLKDIGLTRADVEQESGKPFWRL